MNAKVAKKSIKKVLVKSGNPTLKKVGKAI